MYFYDDNDYIKFPIDLETDDGYGIRITKEQFHDLIDSDIPNERFLPKNPGYSFGFLYTGWVDYYPLGFEVLLARGYPRIKDVMGRMFYYIDDKCFEIAYRLVDFFMSLPKEAFIEAYKDAIHGFADEGEISAWGRVIANMIVRKEVTKKEFGDDAMWEYYKKILRDNLAREEYNVYKALEADYDGSEAFWKKFEQKVAEVDPDEGFLEILQYIENVEG